VGNSTIFVRVIYIVDAAQIDFINDDICSDIAYYLANQNITQGGGGLN
jgi:hypothetical protein